MSLVDSIADERNLFAAVAFYQAKYIDAETGRYRHVAGSHSQTLEVFMSNVQREVGNLSKALSSGYSFSPYVKRTIIAEDGKRRAVCQPTVRDMVVLKAMTTVVAAHFDHILSPQCFAYRVGDDSPKIMDALRRVIRMTRSPQYWVLREDIDSFFDSVSLQLLSDQLGNLFHSDARLYELFRSYLFAPRVEGKRLSIPEKGLPTGTSPSNFLANVFLDSLDKAMASLRGRYFRYCDDLLVFARSHEEAINSKIMIKDALAMLELKPKDSKSQLLEAGGAFSFLGYQFSCGTPKIGPKAMRRFKNNIRRVTRRELYRRTRQDLGALASAVIQAANQHVIVAGSDSFVSYFSLCDVEDQFRDMDEWILDRIRGVLGDSWRRGLRRKFPVEALRLRGLRSLVQEYHACRTRRRKPTRPGLT